MREGRPWKAPKRDPAIRMRWHDLLFAHWVTDAAVLRNLLPAGLELDLFRGRAYVGVVPFRMEGVRMLGMPAVHGLSAFPELNLRTYVTAGGKPGVWFFSLDAGQRMAVRVARHFFHLPYFNARFTLKKENGGMQYSAERGNAKAVPAKFAAFYRPLGEVYRSAPGTLEAWLTERYCLYAADDDGQLYRGEIDHTPWPLQAAEAELAVNTLGDWLGIAMTGPPDSLLFAQSLKVDAWWIKKV